ncbi:isochorismatase family protein [Anaerococcus sp. NML200574]|uniref:isochorismatase family protein n=1 Tax=Anaerococcus sp. NML200574 TaxID=2954486 RepID=UPI0022389C6F|nr:isochorismatase family protein [Anaerococcus sp. NML200574]MCW6678412.1 isochorismatase family protein [Anaerococcus sp. NML200574]
MERKLDSKFYTNSLASDGLYTDRSKTLLLVVDIQPKLMTSVEEGERVTKNTVGLIKAFKAYDLPIIATEQYPKGLGRSDERILAELCDEKIFPKTSFNALIPEVLDFIKDNDIKNVVVTGAEGHICIYQTIRSLLDLGLNVFYVDDAIESFTNELKDGAKASLRDMGAVLVNTELILFDLAIDSKDSNFKLISNLVKELRK